MIKIEDAEKIVNEYIDSKPFISDINREGAYLLFEDIKINNIVNIDYNFILYVASAFFDKNRSNAYKHLNKALNEINKSAGAIELKTCQAKKKEKNLLIYELKLKVNIIG